MNSSFLCVIIIGLLFQVFAQVQFQSQLWQTNLQKLNEENEDRFHSQLWRRNYEKINKENKNRKAYELAVFMANNGFEDVDHPPRMRTDKDKAYWECTKKTRVSPDTILNINEGNWKDCDPKAKSWVQCVLMENGLMTDQSVFRLDVAFKKFSSLVRESLEANIDKCLPTKAMPPVEISWEFAKCFQTADPENSLF